jgi:hypothetical protein
MKEVAILLLLVLMLNGCGSSANTVQAGAGGIWQAQLYGGSGQGSGFSFITQFTVNSDSSLNITSFQFLTQGTCFTSVSPAIPTGSVVLIVQTNDTVTGTITYVVTANGNTLTLKGTVTGTAIVTSNNSSTTLTGASMSGTWSTTGSAACTSPGGSFTMNQSST